MELRFAKMHGAANDFVVLPMVPPRPPLDANLVEFLCDRRRGIGGDGALFLEKLKDDPEGAIFHMHFYNNDGGRVRMCFNGARCCALYAQRLGWANESFSFRTDYGLLGADVDGSVVKLRFAPPQVDADEIALPSGSPVATGHPVITGDPHLVVEVDLELLDNMDFEGAARPLRWWPGVSDDGANVHFVARDQGAWHIRSYERGVEGETWACGSGCIAAAGALGEPGASVELITRGGDRIVVSREEPQWSLTGPVQLVFDASMQWEGEDG